MSFSEMMSSARERNVIGCLIALAIKCMVGFILVFVFHERLQGGESILSQIAQQEQDLAHYRNEISAGELKLEGGIALVAKAKELENLKRENNSIKAQIEMISQKIDGEKIALAGIGEAFSSYKEQYRVYIRSKAKGQLIDKIETRSGMIYNNVIIREVTATGITIRHSDGQKPISFEELPEVLKDQFQFDPEEKVVSSSENSPSETPAPRVAAPQWMPKSKSEVADCSLLVKVSKGVSVDGSIQAWNGTAFLCNHGAATYIYSNAHNFDGAIEFSIIDKNGKKYDDFVSIETAAEGCALWKETGFGGDVVRIRLQNFREKALTIDYGPITDENAKTRKILVTGNTGGRGVITELEGVVTAIAEDHIIKHNAATEGGNSGSPIVDLNTYKVIGILTWGLNIPNSLQAIWLKKPAEVREGINTGAALATVRFSPTSFKQLQRQRVVMNDLKKNVRLLGLLDALVPTKQGLFVDRNARVMGDYTVDDLLQESADHPVVRELSYLDQFLSEKAKSNIGISNQDMLKRYVDAYGKCLPYISNLRLGIENSNSVTFFLKCKLKQSRMLEISKAYEAMSVRSLNWYSAQKGTRGEALPLSQRLRLPEFRTGLEGLGIGDK